MQDGLKEIIERDSFYASEVKIFQMVEGWAIANNLKNTPQLNDVLSAVRFELMTPGELFNVVRPTGFVSSDTILDALQLQSNARDSSLKYRGFLCKCLSKVLCNVCTYYNWDEVIANRKRLEEYSRVARNTTSSSIRCVVCVNMEIPLI